MSKRSFTRRGLLKRTAASTAAAVAAPYVLTSTALGAPDGTPPASERITMGHIGVGGRGGGLLGNFLSLKDCRCVAVADAFKSKQDRGVARIDTRYRAKGAKAYGDFRELLARDDIDAVVIATPDHWHVPAAFLAAKAGKDMYVEKPLGLCMEWNFALRKAIRRYGRVFQYGTQQRSSGHLRHAVELVHSGYIGDIKAIEIVAPGGRSGGSTTAIPVPAGLDYDMWLGPAPKSPYTKDRCTNSGSWFVYDNSIGFLGGWGAHPLDIGVWGWSDELSVPVEIEGTGTIPTTGLFNTVTKWSLTGKYANGMRFKFTHGGDLTTFIGTEGTVAVSRGKLRTTPDSLRTKKLGPNDKHMVNSTHHGQNFLDSIKTRKDAVSNIDDAVQSDTISHLADIAIRTGRKITWDHKAEKIVGDDQAARMATRALRSPWRL